MNDIKNLIDRLEAYRNDDNPFLYPDDIMTMEEFWILMDYIHELEKKNKYGEQLACYEAAFKGTELHNWDNLKKWLNNEIDEYGTIGFGSNQTRPEWTLAGVLEKMDELEKQPVEESKKDKKILVFKCNCRLKPETKESLRLELKRDIEEGVVVLDSSFDHPIMTTLPKDCEYEIFVESLEEEE